MPRHTFREDVPGRSELAAGSVHHMLLWQEWQGSLRSADVREGPSVQESFSPLEALLSNVQGRSW